MSNLWVTAAAYQHEAMAWEHDRYRGENHHYTPITVKQAGFAGHVGDTEYDNELKEDLGEHGSDHEGFDEDLHDQTRPEPTSEEHAHYEEHGDYPDDYYKRHDQEYHEALERKIQQSADEDTPDHEDPALMGFVREHGSNTKLWHDYGRVGKVSLKQPVWATQAHVAREHIDRYKNNPRDTSDHVKRYGPRGPGNDYVGEEHPMFVTHHGRLHVTEGHHRVAAALERGEHSLHGAHFNLDEHPQFEHGANPDEDD